jgi:DNA-directed RNA polymerase subunit RPC12/RpoP
MGLIAAKCSQCGCKLEIDPTRQRNFCPACGTEFIQEKVVDNKVTNIQNQTNIYLTNKEPRNIEADKNLLNLFFYSMDFDNLKRKALDVIENDKNDKFAQFLYQADFKVINQTSSIKLVEFQETPVLDYFVNNVGKIDLDFTKFIFGLFMRETSNFDADVVYKILINNVNNLNLSNNQLLSFYKDIVRDSCVVNDKFIEIYLLQNNNLSLVANILNNNNTNLAKLIIHDLQEKKMGEDEIRLLNDNYNTNINTNTKFKGIMAGVIIAVFAVFMIIVILQSNFTK